MWITGFDVPSCSTMYLDKPMKNHTLMQTIARANRVWKDKQSALIVDYVGIFRNLQKALAIYGTTREGTGESPIRDKIELFNQLVAAIAQLTTFSKERGVDPGEIQKASGFDREKLKDDAVAAFVITDETRRRYLQLSGSVDRLLKSLLPDVAANEFAAICKVFSVIAAKIRSDLPAADISEVMEEVSSLLDYSISTQGYVIKPSATTANYIDLSQIDFDALRAKFDKGRKATVAQELRGTISQKLVRMVRLNRTRIDFLQEFQKMIAWFARLTAFAQRLSEEERRGIAEELTEEELVIFDLLTKPEVTLTKAEEREVKKVAKQLLETLKREKLVLDWKKRQSTRAAVRYTIETVLDELPRTYTPDMYTRKCELVYQHVFDSYAGQGRSLYVSADLIQ
jgi:type I restriction enzyme R subunit